MIRYRPCGACGKLIDTQTENCRHWYPRVETNPARLREKRRLQKLATRARQRAAMTDLHRAMGVSEE